MARAPKLVKIPTTARDPRMGRFASDLQLHRAESVSSFERAGRARRGFRPTPSYPGGGGSTSCIGIGRTHPASVLMT
jgi:hypothetical protein